ncbi:unnamed protein product [Rotaria sp. Silwood1]|nr:unnamed protein product [Rotaria sp. Silwood1]CAF0942578.1 unnamed protein product [Rotaria sp. Silwood1]CAF3356313.1 unnamed protein product [Rotaria sp. Silwood1]CAF3394518.1 unnamed protein product [Rotaria sp. Silwood1]CAF3394747.1 unnamed protein product [Rotaria sp. Silwood1]
MAWFIITCFLLFLPVYSLATEQVNETTSKSYGFQSNIDYIYHYATDVHMDHKIWAGSEESHIKRHTDAAFHLYARLNLTSVWRSANGEQHLLKIELKDARFVNRTNSHSMIDCLALSTLIRYPSLFMWDQGTISLIYFNENDNLAAINLKKGIISLFQYKQDNATETDTLGKCNTEYRIYEDRLIKDKSACSNIQYSDEYSSAKQFLNYSMDFQSTCVYTFDNSTIKSASCSDMAFPRLIIPEVAGFRIMSRLSVDLIDKIDNDKRQVYSSSDAALKSILGVTPEQYHPLETEKQVHPCDDYCEKFDEFIEDHSKELTRSNVGNRVASDVFLHLIALTRRQSESTLNKVLEKASKTIKLTLIEAFVSAQTPASLNAVLKHLDSSMNSKNKVELIEGFLMTSAFAPRPTDLLLEKILERLSKFTSIDNQLEQSTYLTLGAIVNKLFDLNKKSSTIEKYTTLLHNTKKKALVYLSLYNAKLELYESMIVDEIRRCNDTNLCWLALNALTQYNPEQFSKEIIDILRSIYHEQAGRPKTNIQIRQLCGQLLLRTDISIGDLVNLILSAIDKTNHQLGVYMWRLISTMAEHDELLFRKIKFIFNGGLVDITYDSLAYKGQSDFYRRPFVQTFGFGVYYTISQLMSRLGALRESDFDLHIQQYDKKDKFNLLSFGVSASGLEAYVSDDGKASDTPDENLQAELRITLLNMQLRPVVLFSGVTGFMSAVWSAPSELTSAFKSNIMVHDVSRYIHLHNGLVVHYEAQSAASLDLSGMASISLWNKNSHSVIRVSSGLSVRSHVDILNDFVTTGINVTISTDVVVDYTTDVDYADTPINVCMQMSVKPSKIYDHVENFYSLKRTKAFRWFGNRTRHFLGQDYTFTQKNNDMCRQIHMIK